MNLDKPKFELTRIYSDGTKEEPQIVRINDLSWNTNTGRRGFLGTGLFTSVVLASLTSCKYEKSDINQFKGISNIDLYAHCKSITELAISPDGKILTSGSFDETIKLWSLPEGNLLKTVKGHSESIKALAVSPDGKILASGSLKAINLWSLPEANLFLSLENSPGGFGVEALAISADGKILASGSIDGTIILVLLPEGNLLEKLEGHTNSVRGIAISPDGKILASASLDETINLWSLPEGNLLKTLEHHSRSVESLAISPDGKILVSASLDETIKLWSLPKGNLLKTLKGHSESIKALAVSPDGKILASGSQDNTIKLWSLPEGNLLKTLEGSTSSVAALAISPDGKILVSGSGNGAIQVWDIVKQEFTRFLHDPACNVEKALSYNIYDQSTGSYITYTLPCGSPIPEGATCTCNCVTGTYKPQPAENYGAGTYCSCNKVCTCIPICQAHNLIHPDQIVSMMAREILLFMGIKEIDYMRWAAANSIEELKAIILSVIDDIKLGLLPEYNRWPTINDIQHYLHHEDEVVSIMAAQMINMHCRVRGQFISNDLRLNVDKLLMRSEELHWEKQ